LLSVLAADLLVLLSLVLVHFAVLELMDIASLPYLGFVLLVVQGITDLVRLYGGMHGRIRIVMAGVLIGLQAGQTGLVLLRKTKRGARLPAYFSGALLLAFMLANFARSLATQLGMLDDRLLFERVEGLTFLLYLAFALGISFGFFWMTTALLTASLDELASTDPLTRLYNRRVFLRWCERELARSRNTGAPFTILMVDLDHFKTVNDRFGHAAGDEVLCGTVERMQGAVRGIDVLGRWGGEEFVALLPGASAEAALIVAQRVRGNIERTSFEVANGVGDGVERIGVTTSVGVATYRGADDNIELMLKRADEALYAAKKRGRNQVRVDAASGSDRVALQQT